jgi:uncharacterized protein (DUF1501 family)
MSDYTPRHRASESATVDIGATVAARDELKRHGPNLTEAALRVHASDVCEELEAQRRKWDRGFTRRRMLAGVGMAGVAALGSQLVTTRVSYAARADNNHTLIIVFLSGGMDGLSVVVPSGDANYRAARPNIAVPADELVKADGIFGLHPAFKPLEPLWKAGTMAAIHAVGNPDRSRSHFQAQEVLERGSSSQAVRTGWLDRALTEIGPGTTFRAVAEGDSMPRSLVGTEAKLVMNGLEGFRLNGPDFLHDKTIAALKTLYTGFEHPVAQQAKVTIKALNEARRLASQPYNPKKPYPGGGFANHLRDVARMIKAGVGLRVVAMQVGGWDMHTDLGNFDGGEMVNHLNELAGAFSAFADDLGPKFADVTLLTMTEFGRRIEQNGNNGTDHGYGGLMLAFGGGLNGGQVHGKWPGLAESQRDNGDLAGVNDIRDVLAEALVKRMGVGDAKKVFPDHTYKPLGVFA